MTTIRHQIPQRYSTLLLPLIATIGWLFLSPVLAQGESPVDAPVTRALLESHLQEAEASSELGEDSQAALVELYRRGLSQIEQRSNYEARAAEYIEAREGAPAQAAILREELESLTNSAPPTLDESLGNLPLVEMEQRLLSEKSELALLDNRVSELEAALRSRAQRSQQALARIDAAGQRRSEIVEALKLPVPEGQAERQSQARRWALELESLSLGAEIDMLNQELVGLPSRLELLTLQRDQADLEQGRKRQLVAQLEARVADRRQAEAASAIEEAQESEREVFGKHPLLQELALKNRQLGEQLEQLAAELAEINRDKNQAAVEANRVAENFRLARLKLDIGGLDEALGQALLEERRELPDSRDFRVAEKRSQQLVVESSLRQIRNQQERARLRDAELYANDVLAGLTPTWRSQLREDVLALVESRRNLVDRAIAADDRNLQALGELDVAYRQLAQAVTEYDRFLDEHMLWVRTAEPPSIAMLASTVEGLAIYFDATHWRELGRALFLPGSTPWILILALSLFLPLRWQRRRLRRLLNRSGEQVGKFRRDRYHSTVRALLLTLLLALPSPLLIALTGWHLDTLPPAAPGDGVAFAGVDATRGKFVAAMGAAALEIALYLFYFVAFRILCQPGGLAEAHFGWNSARVAQLRDATWRLSLVLLPAVFLMNVAFAYDSAALGSGLSRLFFIILLLSVAWYFYRLLAPESGLLYDSDTASAQASGSWQRYLWLAMALALPLLLAVLAAIGYVYTAAELGTHLFNTLWLVVAIILIHQLTVRWILLTERRLKFRDRLERRRAMLAAREAQHDGEAADGGMAPEEPGVDFSALSEDTSKLVNTALALLAALGMWVIWSEVLPAFRILDEVSLWSYSTLVGDAEEVVPVLLSDVFVGALVAFFGVIAARRFPALLEITLLARLNITAGSRYAITTLTQYAIVAVVIILVFNMLGGRWGDIQWLIAALGVGIGFGLQEIVANFISGLILLFERPIRIGDVVTVGDTTGVVTRIRIRSTTIRNWDQQELIVPNKEFITGRLLNWTLTDGMTRIVITVGVAYGSDVGKALKLVGEAATEHERVLEEPAPMVTLENFGDNSLNIVLRCYIGSMEFRLPTLSEVNQEINRKLTEAGIEIAFPQRDLHLDTSSPLELKILPDKPAPDGA